MLYSVKYKRTGSFFWKSIKKIKGDGVIESIAHRFFILDDETRVEIPMKNMIFKFDHNRFLAIQQQMEQESAQKMSVVK